MPPAVDDSQILRGGGGGAIAKGSKVYHDFHLFKVSWRLIKYFPHYQNLIKPTPSLSPTPAPDCGILQGMLLRDMAGKSVWCNHIQWLSLTKQQQRKQGLKASSAKHRYHKAGVLPR